MAKVRFYVDVPEYKYNGCVLFASSNPAMKSSLPGSRRIAFDVDLPPSVWKAFDEPAQASNVHETLTEDEGNDE